MPSSQKKDGILYRLCGSELFGRSESYVETEVEACCGMAYRYELRCYAEELVVAADEEVESFGVEVDHPAERRTVGRSTVVDGGVKPFHRFHGGVEAAFSPR